MSEEDALTEPTAGGIFPFLSVLICTMGVMVLILIGGSLGSTLKGSGAAESLRMKYENLTSKLAERTAVLEGLESQILAIENAKVEAVTLAERTARLQSEIDAVRKRTASHEKRLEALKHSIAELAPQVQAARDTLKKLSVFRSVREAAKVAEEARTLKETEERELANLQRTAEELQQGLADLESRRAELVKRVESPECEISFDGGPAPAVVFELHRTGAVVLGSQISLVEAGKTFAMAELEGESGVFERAAVEVARKGGYVLLIVRPGAVPTYLEAKKALRKWRAPFRLEPAEENWAVKLAAQEGP